MSVTKQHIIFNLDDTLIHCNKYFEQAILRFAELMTGWFPAVSREEVKKKQLELDIISVEKHGLTTEHFSQSFVDVYQFYAKRHGVVPEGGNIQTLRELGDSVFQIPVEPLPYMYETLELLKNEGHELYLHTGGDDNNQRRKIAQLQLAAYFDNRVFISLHKDTEALRNIMRRMGLNAENTWMVGNSVRTDIVPALELGVNTIHIPAKSEWSYNVIDVHIKPNGAYITLESLSEVPEAIYNYLREKAATGGIDHWEADYRAETAGNPTMEASD